MAQELNRSVEQSNQTTSWSSTCPYIVKGRIYQLILTDWPCQHGMAVAMETLISIIDRWNATQHAYATLAVSEAKYSFDLACAIGVAQHKGLLSCRNHLILHPRQHTSPFTYLVDVKKGTGR